MKRLILIITALVLTVMLASCGSGGSSGTDTTSVIADITADPSDTRLTEYDYYADGAVKSLRYTDNNGNEVERINYTSTGIATDRTVSTYDGTQLIRIDFYLGESELSSTTEYTYNDDGSENDIIRRRADGYVLNYCTYKYGDDGTLTICDRYWSETDKHCEDYSYNEKGTLTGMGRREYKLIDGIYYEYVFDSAHTLTDTLTYDADPMPQPAE